MFQALEAAFESHGVLRAKALNDLFNSNLHILEQMYSAYGDGILRDFIIEQQEEFIVVRGGLLKHQGKLYCNDGDVRLRLNPKNQQEYLKVMFQEETVAGGLRKWTSDVVLDEKEPIRNNEYELCRFQYQQGAKLRNHYSSFQDCASSYNVVNVLHAKYAAPGGDGLAPLITMKFAEELQKKELTDPYDILFGMECARGNVLNRGVILAYIRHKTGRNEKELSNQEIFRELEKLLEGQGKTERPRQREQRMIII